MSEVRRRIIGIGILIASGVVALWLSWDGRPANSRELIGLIILSVLGAIVGSLLAIFERRMTESKDVAPWLTPVLIGAIVGGILVQENAEASIQLTIVTVLFALVVAFVIVRGVITRDG